MIHWNANISTMIRWMGHCRCMKPCNRLPKTPFTLTAVRSGMPQWRKTPYIRSISHTLCPNGFQHPFLNRSLFNLKSKTLWAQASSDQPLLSYYHPIWINSSQTIQWSKGWTWNQHKNSLRFAILEMFSTCRNIVDCRKFQFVSAKFLVTCKCFQKDLWSQITELLKLIKLRINSHLWSEQILQLAILTPPKFELAVIYHWSSHSTC